MKRSHIVYWLIGLFAYLFIPLSQANASGEFQADYDVEYAVAPTGVTIVTQNVTLTNLQSNFYPKQYSITIDTEKIQNVIARDSVGIMTPGISQNDGKTEITLPFNAQVVGLGKQTTFTLRYDNLDVAAKHGTIWEINIPGVTDTPDINSYSVSLQVPPLFGPNAYISPLPLSGRKWTKDQMVRGGISAAYGKEQNISLHLSYYLENTKLTPAYEEIALPPDTAYQKVYIASIDPHPTNVRKDADGNWLARFDLGSSSRLTVNATVTIVLDLAPRAEWKQESQDISSYLKSLQYWNSDDNAIITLAKTYKTPRAIYEYVVSTLGYDYTRVKDNPIRKGAVEALKTPNQSVCMEFTDTFIAIARAAGIPARENVGYAYTTNAKLRPLSLISDVLHSWPEYWDSEKNTWIPIDPTWGNTTGGVNYFDKLDFNHIIFAVHGLSSSTPYPVGFYHEAGKTTKDIDVTFLDKAPQFPASILKTTIQIPKVVTAGIQANGTVTVENTSGVSANNVTVVIQGSPFGETQTHTETNVPPFAKLSYPVSLSVQQYLTSGTGRIAVSTNDQTVNSTYKIRPIYWTFLPALGALTATLLILLSIVNRKRIWNKLRKH